ncbi:MAG TPA: hypothetical protein VNM42_07045 [Solirubrobacterales bacterium]|nr:hypothetical protein [Solirubrobacterales bacterium]
MPEILTESFCERCGTRYTFESAAPRVARLKGIKVMSRGLKNFVMSDDTSMDEAMAAARSETDREATSQQLDAFHKTFNFCMNCRQYTCGNCWNEADGQCLSCSPHLGHEIMPAPFPDLDAPAGLTVAAANGTNGTNGNGHDDGMAAMAWPTSDLMRDAEVLDATEPTSADDLGDLGDLEQIDAAARLAALGAVATPEPAELVAAPDSSELVADAPTEAPDVAATAAPTPEAPAPEIPVAPPAASESNVGAVDAGDVDGRAAVASDQTSAMFRRFRPGQSLDDEIAAYEREQAAAEAGPAAAEAGPADAGAVAGGLAAAAALEATDDAAAPEATPPTLEPSIVEATSLTDAAPVEPVTPTAEPSAPPRDVLAAAAIIAAVPEAAAVEAPEPAAPEPAAPAPVAPAPVEPIAAEAAPPTAADDIVPQPTWQIIAPDATPAEPTVPTAEPQWPTQPEWPSQRPATGLPFLGRPAASAGGLESLWAESAREVASTPAAAARPAGGVAPCISCGLSLSATARFCRRCGTRQG